MQICNIDNKAGFSIHGSRLSNYCQWINHYNLMIIIIINMFFPSKNKGVIMGEITECDHTMMTSKNFLRVITMLSHPDDRVAGLLQTESF